jgi:hypothetical protein
MNQTLGAILPWNCVYAAASGRAIFRSEVLHDD